MLFRLARPALFTLEPERAHRLTIAALKLAPPRAPATAGTLGVAVAGLRFPNPVGLAAGFVGAMIDTAINFQPYAVSDGRGWCGSTLLTNPNGVEQMAGQLTFDFAFDAYLGDGVHDPVYGGGTQIVPDFVMRSYGDYVVTINGPNAAQTALTTYRGSAVINNTNPILLEDSPERRIVEEHGLEVAADGLELEI